VNIARTRFAVPWLLFKGFSSQWRLVLVRHKNKVKHWYLRNICKALKYIQEIEEMKKDN